MDREGALNERALLSALGDTLDVVVRRGHQVVSACERLRRKLGRKPIRLREP